MITENYNANSIETLDFRTAVRTRVAMYMGSADNQGVLQCIREIITNSIDEATMGFGNTITVELFEGNKIRIGDFARGVPFGKREDGTEALEAVYMSAHSGGKFSNKTYQNVAGLNGIGAKGTALSSSFFQVWSYRDGKCATLQLIDGLKKLFEITDAKSTDRKSGTVVEFIPSQEVYNLETINIDFEEVKKMCHDWSYLSRGIAFELSNHITGENITYLSKNGLIDLMNDNAGKTLHRTPLHIEVTKDDVTAEIVMAWTNSRKEEWHCFTNGLENSEGGTSLTGIKTALTNFFRKKIHNEIDSDIFRRGLYYAVSCKVPNPSFSDQTKRKVNNPVLRGLCQRATNRMLEQFEREHKDEFNKIIEVLGREAKAEIAAEKAREQVLKAIKDVEKTQKRKVIDSDKLKDAEYLGQDSMLLVVEGNSALGGMSLARDVEHTGLMAIRGKIINCLSNTEDKIYQNEEIKLLLSAMNIVPGRYNADKLRYGKLAICSDADSDKL